MISHLENEFPSGVKAMIGYGSGIIKQKHVKGEQKDLILVIENSEDFHKLNLIKNPNHYSFLKSFSPYTLSKLQNEYGTGMYFMPFCEIQSQVIFIPI